MNPKYSNAFFAAFFSPNVVLSGFSSTMGAGVDTGVAGVDTGVAGVFGFEEHPVIPITAIKRRPVMKKITSLFMVWTMLQGSIKITDVRGGDCDYRFLLLLIG